MSRSFGSAAVTVLSCACAGISYVPGEGMPTDDVLLEDDGSIQDPAGFEEDGPRGVQGPWPFRTCEGMSEGAIVGYTPVLRIPLRVHVGGSDLSDDDVCGVMEEINEIWWTQAGICFEIDLDRRFEATRAEEKEPDVLNMWLLRDSALFPAAQSSNGVYLGGSTDEAYTVDSPSLGSAPNPARYFAARTGAHELGHALTLGHQNCGSACDDLLMTSGRQGTALVTGSPADEDEFAEARDFAVRGTHRALKDTTPNLCAAPRFVE